MQNCKLIQDTGDPSSKAADRSEIQQERGSWEILIQRHVDQVEISDAVS